MTVSFLTLIDLLVSLIIQERFNNSCLINHIHHEDLTMSQFREKYSQAGPALGVLGDTDPMLFSVEPKVSCCVYLNSRE